MRTPLFTTLLVTTALASPYPAPNSDLDIIQIRQVEVDVDRRQAAASTMDQAAATSIDYATLIPSACLTPTDIAPEPTPPAALESAAAAWTPTDPCDTPSFTGSIGAEYTSYASALSAWAKSNSAKLESWESMYLTACPYAATLGLASASGSAGLPSGALTGTAYNTALLYSMASCGASSTAGAASHKASGASTAASSSLQTGGTATAAAGSASATKAGSTGGAPKQTAFAAAAGVLAGFAGVVAAL